MEPDRATALFFELFSGLPRQGPGNTVSTLRALGFVSNVGHHTRVLDIGCGTGAQTLVLARSTPSRIVAIDNHPHFIEALNHEARRLRITDRLEARVSDMRSLDFADGSFDLIWCEGAIYNVGIEAGLHGWRRLLRHNGHIALTDVCWRKPKPPSVCISFWNQEYPAIRDTTSLLEAVEACGYEIVAHFPLPESAWWDDYYRPLQDNIAAFRRRHRDELDAEELADKCQHEIDVWHDFSEFYCYEFIVLRVR